MYPNAQSHTAYFLKYWKFIMSKEKPFSSEII